jgi:hypothetical protein
MFTIIKLEDNGQDFLELVTDHIGVIIDAKPFQKEIWKGGYIPIKAPEVAVGEFCPIHKPPHIEYGFLKHKIEKITQVENYY